jgi:hypothetical protein
MTTTRGTRTALVGLATTTLAVLLLAGCSGAGNDSGGDSSGASEAMSAQDLDAGADVSGERAAGAGQPASVDAAAQSDDDRVISTGSVSLVSDDVADTRFDVQRIADEQGGEVAEDSTETDQRGRVTHSRMVLRVPVDAFDEAMVRLERTADLRSSDQAEDVVTDEYVDLQARVRAQEKSLARVELLFARARDIRDIMAIEGELSRRQADLDSLKGQLRVLDDQTTMSTITVHVERAPDKVGPRDDDETGFLVGLRGGWDALRAATVASLTVLGALLPFLLVAALAGVPLWLWTRSIRRRRPAAATPTEPPPAE